MKAIACAFVTLITAQNTQGVDDLHLLDPALVAKQMDAVLDDLGADAVKTGAFGDRCPYLFAEG